MNADPCVYDEIRMSDVHDVLIAGFRDPGFHINLYLPLYSFFSNI
jgi:hypothetical protein